MKLGKTTLGRHKYWHRVVDGDAALCNGDILCLLAEFDKPPVHLCKKCEYGKEREKKGKKTAYEPRFTIDDWETLG